MSPPVAFHPVNLSSELPRLSLLFNTCFAAARTSIWPTEEYLHAVVRQQRELQVWAALLDKALVGAVLMGHYRDGARIESVAVLPEHRRQEIGAGLIQACLRGRPEGGGPVYTAPITLDDAAAVGLAQSQGFVRTDEERLRMSGPLPEQDLPLDIASGYTLRPSAANDAPAWARIVNGAFVAAGDTSHTATAGDFVQGLLQDSYYQPDRVIFACCDGEPVGTVAAWHSAEGGTPVGIVHMLAVDPTHQGKKVGELLFRWCLNRLRREGWRDVWLTTAPNLAAARNLYLRHGLRSAYRQAVFVRLLG
jgi:predicted N-acetyltransferase YhbS